MRNIYVYLTSHVVTSAVAVDGTALCTTNYNPSDLVSKPGYKTVKVVAHASFLEMQVEVD